MYPVLANGDVLGAVALLDKEGPQQEPGETRTRLVQAAAAFLGSQMKSLEKKRLSTGKKPVFRRFALLQSRDLCDTIIKSIG